MKGTSIKLRNARISAMYVPESQVYVLHYKSLLSHAQANKLYRNGWVNTKQNYIERGVIMHTFLKLSPMAFAATIQVMYGLNSQQAIEMLENNKGRTTDDGIPIDLDTNFYLLDRYTLEQWTIRRKEGIDIQDFLVDHHSAWASKLDLSTVGPEARMFVDLDNAINYLLDSM